MLIPDRVRAIPAAYFDALNRKADALRSAGRPVISLGQAIPGFDPPPAAIEAARASLSDRATHVYSDDAGMPALRGHLAEHLARRRGLRVTEDNVLITAGANQAIMLALQTLVDAGAEVLLPSPYFVNHEMAIRAVGAVPVEVPLSPTNGYRLDWDAMLPYLTPRTRALIVCTPSNPTGTVVAPEAMTRILMETRSRGIVVVSDETYMDFVFGNRHWSPASLPEWPENVLVAGSFSKSFGMTGWRVGFLLAAPGLLGEAVKIQDAALICAPVISQLAVLAALREAPDHALGFVPELRRRRDCLTSALRGVPDLRWVEPAGGFFVFVRVDDCIDSEGLAEHILERAHVVTVPGAIFGRTGEGSLRLSFGAVDTETITQACRRLTTAVAEWRTSRPRRPA